MTQSVTLSRENIEKRVISENEAHEFKEKSVLDSLEKNDVKADLVDDVVGFLNAEREGYIIFGVKEDKSGYFKDWTPITGNRDQLGRRLISSLCDSIDPKPFGLKDSYIDLGDEAFALVLNIPVQRMQPYQNTRTGGFKIRMSAQNRIIPRAEIGARFRQFEDYRARLAVLCRREEERLKTRAVLRANAPMLVVGVLPREHFDQGPAFTDASHGIVKHSFGLPFHDGRPFFLKGCEDGYESFNGDLERFFVGDDWFMHACIAHPFEGLRRGSVDLQRFKTDLGAFTRDLERCLRERNCRGPFLIHLEVQGLRNEQEICRCFGGRDRITYAAPTLTPTVSNESLIETFVGKMRPD